MKKYNVLLTDGSDWEVKARNESSAINKARKTPRHPGRAKGVYRRGWYFWKVSLDAAYLMQ